MRYFTRELWLGAQNTKQSGENDRQWKQAFDEYRAQLELLQPRVNPESYRFFAEADVHDGELMKLEVIDGSRPAPLSESPRSWSSPTHYPVQVNLVVLDAYDKYLWELNYMHLRRVIVDYPTEEPLFHTEGEGFGDWGYHELTDAGSGFLRHEVLFATGTTLLFEFREVTVKIINRAEANQ